MSQSEFTGMLVVASVALITLISVFVKLSWNMSKTLAEINTTLKVVVKISDEHDKRISDLEKGVQKNTNSIELVQRQCKYAHKFDD